MDGSTVPVKGFGRRWEYLNRHQQVNQGDDAAMNGRKTEITVKEHPEENKGRKNQGAEHDKSGKGIQTLTDHCRLQRHKKGGGKGSLVVSPEAFGGLDGSLQNSQKRMGTLPGEMGLHAIGKIIAYGMIIKSHDNKRNQAGNE